MRDKIHMQTVEQWAEFVRNNPRDKWKPVIDSFVNAVYDKSSDFYNRLEKTEEGREILKRLKEERLRQTRAT